MSEIKYQNLSQTFSKDVPISTNNLNLNETFPIHSQSFIHKDKQSSLSLGFQRKGPASAIFPEEELAKDPKLVRLAYVKGKNLVCENQALNILKYYKANPVVFVGVYGRANAGKSFWLDKILNLAKINGKYYSTAWEDPPSLNFFATPFRKANLKLFFLDFNGFQNEDLSREEKMRLDLMMSLCSMIILMPDPKDEEGDIMRVAYDHFDDCRQRLRMQNKAATSESSYWPQSLYCLYRSTKPVKKQLQKIGQLFNDYNFSIIHDARVDRSEEYANEMLREQDITDKSKINEDYIDRVQTVFCDIYEKLRPKQYGNLKSHGKVMSVMIPQLKNSIENQKSIQFSNVINDTTRKLYAENHPEMMTIYDRQIGHKFSKQHPESTKKMLENFKSGRNKVYSQFDKETRFMDPKSPYHKEYEDKLQHYILNQQRNYQNTEKNSSNKLLERNLPNSDKIHSNEQALQYVDKLKNYDKDLNHDGRAEIIGKKLKDACEKNKKNFFLVNADFDQIENLQKSIKESTIKFRDLEKQRRNKESKLKEKEDQYRLLFLKDSRLDTTIDLKKKAKSLDKIGDEGKKEKDKNDLEKQKKSKLQDKLDKIKRERDYLESWLQKEDNIKSEFVIAQVLSDIEGSQIEKSKKRNSINQSRLVSRLAKINQQGAEIRKIDEKKSTIKKSRLK